MKQPKKTRLHFKLEVRDKRTRVAKALFKYGEFILVIKDQKEGGVLLTPYVRLKKGIK